MKINVIYNLFGMRWYNIIILIILFLSFFVDLPILINKKKIRAFSYFSFLDQTLSIPLGSSVMLQVGQLQFLPPLNWNYNMSGEVY